VGRTQILNGVLNMKRIVACAAAAVLAWPVALLSQTYPNVQNPPRSESQYNHGEFGVYGDYFRLTPRGASGASNYLGLGGRVSFNMNPHTALEGEMNYDFERNYTTINSSGGTTSTVTSSLRPLTGLFGPKFQLGSSGPFRAFVTGKVGFTDFTINHGTASGMSFANSFSTFGNGGTHFAMYPGGGIEAFAGPFGFRIEAGDEIYMNNGANNNLRITFAPTFRF
jgi:hypothetical protein